MDLLQKYREESAGLDTLRLLRWAITTFGAERTILASSFSIEDQLLTYYLSLLEKDFRTFTLDTGRHFQETYDVMQKTMRRYGVKYEVVGPDHEALEPFVSQYGPNCFYDSIDMRQACCSIRKTEPLKRILGTVDAWICGLRKDQSPTRSSVEIIEWDLKHAVYKINPLALWNEDEVWDCIRKHDIPFSLLYERGFRSVGCQPCTRAVSPGEDIRSGRWWWESPEHKECGLHRK